MTDDINQALTTAVNAHDGQTRWGGAPYIVHPVRVAMSVMGDGYSSECVVAALLHDVVEDTHLNLASLDIVCFGPLVVSAVDALTRRPGEKYFDYVKRCSENPIAAVVKRADLLDNIRSSDGQHTSLVTRYKKSLAML